MLKFSKKAWILENFLLTCFLLTIDCALSIFETFRSRSRKKLSSVSLLALERFCPSTIVSLTIILVFEMVTVWPKYYWTATFHSLLKLTDVTAVSGIHANRLHVLCVESLAIVPQPVHSLVAAGAVISLARLCTQAWGPSFSVSRADHSMEVEDDSDTSSSASEDVPSTTASVTSPVATSPPVISTFPRVTPVRSTAAVPTSCPAVAVTAPVKSSTDPVTMTTAASVTVPSASVKVSTASAPESSNSDPSTASVTRPKKPRAVVSGRIFRKCFANHYTSLELPSFDNVTGKEWDSIQHIFDALLTDGIPASAVRCLQRLPNGKVDI